MLIERAGISCQIICQYLDHVLFSSQTIGQAFANVNSKVGQLPPLEVSEASGAPINNYDSQNIRNTLDHYLSELKRKRQCIPAADETAVQVDRFTCKWACCLLWTSRVAKGGPMNEMLNRFRSNDMMP